MATERLQRALELCDRALDDLNTGGPELGEAVLLIQAVRTELLAVLSDDRQSAHSATGCVRRGGR